ncbi:Plasmid recombination enzyme type 3 [Bienertia sinuspersici]
MEGISLRFWHGDLFKKGNNGRLDYVGGMGRVFAVDPDQLCGKELDQGLRRVYADSEVLEMAEIGIKNRGIDLYVLYSVDKPDILDPKEVATRGEIESSDSDESYQPEGESEEDLEGSGSEGLIPEPRHREVDEEFEAEFVTEGECGGSKEDTSDEELINARKNVKGFNTRLFEIATQLQQEAAEGRLGYQRNEGATPCTRNEQAEVLSEYENSSDECHSPPESEDEGVGGILRKQKKSVCITTTDFSKFQWEIGQRFASRLEFRAAVTKYAICQGRDLFFSVSSKNRNQRLGVKCKSGCPFTLYASWDNNKASFVVKSTDPEHTCHRTMENNRQLKSTWLADEFLEVFKARPHWPAAEIIETVRRAYRVLILRDKAYKVKYWAHKNYMAQ